MAELNEATFARETLYACQVYAHLAAHERVPTFRQILENLAATSEEQFDFWGRKSGVRGDEVKVSALGLLRFRLMRHLLGLTLTAKYLIGRKEERVGNYKTYCSTCTVDEDHRTIDAFVERMHAITNAIEERRATFFSNIILGLNDALIELSGALIGFSFALRDATMVTVAGIITGIAASMSMAASAFLQARHEKDRNPFYAALFTGFAYLAVVCVLVAPFIVLRDIATSLVALGVVVVAIITVTSFYSAVLLGRRYSRQFFEMVLFSLVVGAIAFGIGHSLSIFLPL